MDAIRSCAESGAITQNPIGIGYKCVEAAVKAYNGETLPKIIDTCFMRNDKTNIDDPEFKPYRQVTFGWIDSRSQQNGLKKKIRDARLRGSGRIFLFSVGHLFKK